MQCETATRAVTGYLAELILNIASLFGKHTCICQLQLPATITAYLVGFRDHRRLITICGKLAVVSRGIWKNLPRKTVVLNHVHFGETGLK